MLASPNFVRFVYDGDGGGDPDAAGPEGSAAIEQVFLDYFESQDLDRADGVRRPLGLRAVHRRRHPGRWPVLGRRGREDAGAGGGLRWRRRARRTTRATTRRATTSCNINDTSLGQLGDGAAHAALVFAMNRATVSGVRTQAGASTRKGGVKKASKRKAQRRSFAYRGGHLVR